jgi:hypothetical protein
MNTYWTAALSGFDPRQRQKDFSSSLYVQTGSEAHNPEVQEAKEEKRKILML